MGVRQDRVPDYLAEAQKLGDWDSRRGINRKDGAKEDREVFAGSDWWRNYDERQAQQPAVKQGGSQQRSLIHDRKASRSEEHTSELQSHSDLVCRLLLEKKKKKVRRNSGRIGSKTRDRQH